MASLGRIINKNNTSGAWVDSIINKSSTSDSIINKSRSGDDSWTWPPVEPGKLNCILCEKVVTFLHGSTNEFFEHIEIDHKIFINHGLLLSIIFLDNETLNDIRDRFRQNLNALKVTGSAGLEEPFDGDEFDEDNTFHDFTKVLEQNEKETSLSRKENFCNKLENVPKYKPGPTSYKIKQLLKNKQDKLKKINDILRESEKHPDFKKSVKYTKNVFESLNENPKGQLTMKEKINSNKNFQPLKNVLESGTNNERGANILESDTNNERGANFVQHIQPTKHFNNSEVINHINLSEAESVEAKFVKISTLVSPNQDDQFKSDDTLPPNWKSIISHETHFLCPDGSKFPSREMAVEYMKQMGIYTEQDYEKVIAKKTFNPYKPGTKSRKNKRKLKEVNNEILKMQKEIEDDVNSPNYNFLDNDWSKLDDKSYDSEFVESDEVKSQKISKPNTNSASSIYEIKHIDEEEIKNIIYYDTINKDNEKDAKVKKLERSIKTPKQRKASDKDRLSSKYESDVPNEDINLRKHDSLSLNPEEIDSKHTNPDKSKKSEQSQNSGIKYPINVELSEYFLKRPNQLSGYNISESVKNQFVFDESLPNGWKIRKIWRENKNLYDIDYLSPDGRKARSKVAVLEYMKLLGVYSLQDYDKIIQNYDLNLYKICT